MYNSGMQDTIHAYLCKLSTVERRIKTTANKAKQNL